MTFTWFRRVFRLLILLFMPALPLLAQEGPWTVHSSMREVTGVASSDRELWVGTTGGVYRYAPASGEVRRYTVVEGLNGIDVSTVAYDAGCGEEGCVWIGYPNGVIDRLDIASDAVETIRDVQRAQSYPVREINRFLPSGDTLYVATTFGLVLYDLVRKEVRDTYDQFGTIPPQTPVRDVLVTPGGEGGRRMLWLATDEGVVYATPGAENLKDPAAWEVESLGVPPVGVLSLAYFDARIWAGTERDLMERLPDGTWRRSGLTGYPVSDLAVAGDRLLGIDPFALLVLPRSEPWRRLVESTLIRTTGVTVGPDGHVWIGEQQEGLLQVAIPPAGEFLTVEKRYYPTGPYHQVFTQLQIDEAGNLWAAGQLATGTLQGTGFYRRTTGGEWSDYIPRRVTELGTRNSFNQIFVDREGVAWAGSRGNGLVSVDPEGTVTVYDQYNSTLRHAESTTDQNYIIIGGLAADRDGRLWVTNTDAPDPLHVRSSDGTWTGLRLTSCGINVAATSLGQLFIDAFDQKWITVVDRFSLNRTIGLLVLDTGASPTDRSDDTCQFFGTPGTKGKGLPSVNVTSIAEDQEGLVWIGTGNGLAYMVNTGVVARDRSALFIWPQYADRADGDFLFYGLQVNDVTVDPARRLWVATTEGVYLVESEAGGYRVVEHYTADNSPLLSNEVIAVAVDERSGEVFYSTSRGLISHAGDAVAPVASKRDLRVYPNPLRLSEGEAQGVTIDGLVSETDIMILAPSGEVVARFDARGGRVRWDGRDAAGRPVSSGVYLVVAIGQNGEGAAYGKVAIIR